ncbi:MAG TPA: sigma-70 family RNA polymerase sigma factor [Pilimelia sp.]|nr:sigma-70 family RNA polymerase sigma factor [Pilimelia sp.]
MTDVRHDADLCRRLAAGDPTALADAYDCHAAAVYGMACHTLRDPAAAEDVVQEVFLHLWEHPDDYDWRRGRLRAWLCSMARYRAIDRIRRAEVQGRYLPKLAYAGGDVPDAADATIQDMVAKAVRGAVDDLPEPHRTAVVLAYYRGMSYRQVGVALGIAEGTAKSRLRMALRRLYARLAADGLVD